MGSFWRLNHHPKGVNVYFADDDDDDVLLGIRALTLVQHLFFFTFVVIHFHIGETTKRNCCSSKAMMSLISKCVALCFVFLQLSFDIFYTKRGRISFKKTWKKIQQTKEVTKKKKKMMSNIYERPDKIKSIRMWIFLSAQIWNGIVTK